MKLQPRVGDTVTETTDDRWATGDAYDAYMGRWSQLVAREFLGWLGAEHGAHWLEIGCGTGALTASILALSNPDSVVACDPSAAFIAHARSGVPDSRASFVAAAADGLPTRAGGFDVIVSGLVLNFVPEPEVALTAMRERVRPGGVVGAYVWDYAGGVEFLHHFWEEAVASDPAAALLDESRRFGEWQLSNLAASFGAAGLVGIDGTTLRIPTTFANFDDYWRPFLGGTGPAPRYVASLAPAQRDLLAQRLRARLSSPVGGSIRLEARALALRGFRS